MGNLFKQLRSRLPPTQVLIGAAIALASYAVTNWWKADVLEAVKHYSDAIETAQDLDSKLLNLTMFGTISDQINGLIARQSSDKDLKDVPLLLQRESPLGLGLVSYNMLIPYSRRQALVQDFVQSFPADILDTQIKPGLPVMDPTKQVYSNAEMKSCILFHPFAVESSTARYNYRLADLYQSEANKIANLEKYPLTLRDALSKDVQRLDVGNAAWGAVYQESKKAAEPFSGVSESNNKLRTSWTKFCITTNSDKAFDHFSVLLRGIQGSIREKYIAPLENKMRRIELLEKILYAAGALIALFGNKPTSAGPVTAE